MTPPPDPLDPLLGRWSEKVDLRADLEEEVWRRISAAERDRSAPARAWGWLDAWLSRPPFAVLFVACCVLLGLFLAEHRANRIQREHSAQLVRSYVQLIDPLLTTGASSLSP